MSILRSEDMNLLKLIMSKDQEYSIVDIIGQSEMAHFVDANEEQEIYMLPYMDQLRRCDEAEKNILAIINQCNTHELPLQKCKTVEQLTELAQAMAEERKTSVNGLFDVIDRDITNTESFIKEQNDRARQMKEEMNHLIEYYTVLKKTAQMIFSEDMDQGKQKNRLSLGILAPESPEDALLSSGQARQSVESDNSDDGFLGNGGGDGSSFWSNRSRNEHGVAIAYIAGTVNHTEQAQFEKLIFRASRGKVLTRFHEQDFTVKDFDGTVKTKSVYVLIYQEGSYMHEVITRICQSFQGKIFTLPENGQNGPVPFRRMIKELKDKVMSINNLISLTKNQMKEYLMSIQNISEFPEVSLSYFQLQYLRRERAIYTCLNMLTRQGSIVHGYVWSPFSKEEFVEKFFGPEVSLLADRDENSPRRFNLQVETIRSENLNPPTMFKTNEFTKYFQMIVDQYAVPSYKEINPAIYTIISFPFLFGVMYGDVGHGSVLLFVATVLLTCGKSLANRFEGLKDLYEIRYMLFLMAFFSVFCGLMYNDFMSLPMNLFESCYNPKTGVRTDPDCVYPVGIDPIWYGTKQELIFLNSFKMKISVILAILHMSLGLVQKGFNATYFKDMPKLIHEFLPQLILLLAIFGYMDLLIIVKWNTNYTGHTDQAPSIIVTIVNFFLNGGEVKGQEFFTANQFVSQILLLVALVTIPWMLLVNPYLMWLDEKNKKVDRDRNGGDVELNQFKNNDYEVFNDEKVKLLVHEDTHFFRPFVKQQVPELGDEAFGRNNEPGLLNEQDHLIRIIGKRGGGGHHGGDDEFDIVAVAINSMIHTIEFALGTISNTASYLRLWALSLAHSQLAKVFFDMLLASSLKSGSVIGLFLGFIFWASATTGVLLGMDVMEVMLHTVRLHWVEFMSKFFTGEGYAYNAFSFDSALDV